MFEITLTHLSGSRRGTVETLGAVPLKLGRADDCQVRFDAEKDLKVSAYHAELRSDGEGGLLIADLDSKNGVLVNGTKVQATAPLPNHAVVELGVDGPRLKLTFAKGSGGISFSKLKKPDLGATPEVIARNLRTTDETPAYTEADLEQKPPVAPKKEPAGAGAIIAIAVVVIAIAVVAFVAMR